MNRLLITLLLTLLMALIAESRYLAHLEGERTALQRANALLSAGVEQREETIGQLQAEQGRQAEAERALRQSLLRAGELTMNQQLNDQRVIHSDETLQNWSDAALPDGIIRLQQHPAFASPYDYLAWLSRRQQLQDTGKPAGDAGGSADRDPPAGAGAADVRPASRNH
jgi:LysB family phage lysis regulatory protein